MPSHLPQGTSRHLVETEASESLLRLWVPQAAEWVNSNQRIHRMVKADRVKAWRQAALEAVPPGWPMFEEPVRIVAEVWKSRAGRYDPNNLAGTSKACVDGFVEAGLLVDDDWNHVLGPDHRHGGKGEPGLIFTFTSTTAH
jgi:crossover junction endodeoxyribonuclease RusA